MSQKASVAGLKKRLVEGLKVVTGEGILSGSGHLSVRIAGTETFLINPRFAGILAEAADICTVNFEGKRISGKGPIPSETKIPAAFTAAAPTSAAFFTTRSDEGHRHWKTGRGERRTGEKNQG